MGFSLLPLILPALVWAGCHPTCIMCLVPNSAISCNTCHLHAHTQFTTASICYCDSGYYPNPDSRNCQGCHQNCSTCTGPDTWDCTNCPTGAHLAGAAPNVCVCNSGFPSPGVANCVPCSSTCTTCAGPGANDCLTCPTGKVLAGPAPSNCVCPSGSYLNGAACSLCAGSCAACIGGTTTDCISCKNNAMLRGSAPNECGCRMGLYPSPDASNCVGCDSTCLTCIGAGNSQCHTCKLHAVLNIHSCECVPGYFPNPNSGSCTACSPLCLTCISALPTGCTTCHAHSSLINGITPGGCVCDPGFVGLPDVSHCVICPATCLDCTGIAPNSCNSCRSHATLIGTAPSACNCLPGFYPNPHVGACANCHPSCANCHNGAATGCSSCKTHATLTYYFSCVCDPGYYFEPSTENCEVCPPTCSACVGPSTSDCLSCYPHAQLSTTIRPTSCICSPGYYPSPDSGNCKLCDSSCHTCASGTLSDCTGCFPAASLGNGLNPSYCECDRGYVALPDVRSCLPCSQECWTCGGLLDSDCLSCYPNANLAGASPNSCLCLPGYFPNPGVWNCLLCHSTCVGCLNGSISGCLACAPHAKLDGPSPNTCVCDLEFFPAPDTTACSPCADSCLTCADSTPNSCLTCKENAGLSGTAPTSCSCYFGYYQQSGRCYACSPTCSSCLTSGDSKCTGCRGNAVLSDLSPARCMCDLGYFPASDAGNCQKCGLGCEACTSFNQCWNCTQGYVLRGTDCLKCPSECSACDSRFSCLQCIPGLFLTITGACKSCDTCDSPFFLNVSSPYDHIYTLHPNRPPLSPFQPADFLLATDPATPLNWTLESQPEDMIKVTGGGPWANSTVFILEVLGNIIDEFGNSLKTRYFELPPPKNSIKTPNSSTRPPSISSTRNKTLISSEISRGNVGSSASVAASSAIISGTSSGGAGLAAQLLGKCQYFAYIYYTSNGLTDNANEFFKAINQKTWMPNFFKGENRIYRRLNSDLKENRDFFDTAGPFLSLLMLIVTFHVLLEVGICVLRPDRQWVYAVNKEFKWTVYFAVYAFMYLDLVVSALLQLEVWTLERDDVRGLIGTVMSAALLLLAALTPLLIIWTLYARNTNLGRMDFLVLSLRPEGTGRYYYAVFFIQRLVYAAFIVFLVEYPELQSGLCILPVALMAGFVLLTSPLRTRLERILHVLAEIGALVVYILVCAATTTDSMNAQLSWASVVFTVTSLLCSLLLVLLVVVRGVLRCYHSFKSHKTITTEVMYPTDMSFGPHVLFHKA